MHIHLFDKNTFQEYVQLLNRFYDRTNLVWGSLSIKNREEVYEKCKMFQTSLKMEHIPHN